MTNFENPNELLHKYETYYLKFKVITNERTKDKIVEILFNSFSFLLSNKFNMFLLKSIYLVAKYKHSKNHLNESIILYIKFALKIEIKEGNLIKFKLLVLLYKIYSKNKERNWHYL